MPSFIAVLPRKRRLYSGAARDSQLVCASLRRRFAGKTRVAVAKTRLATRFSPLFAQKTMLRPQFCAIPFDFRLRLPLESRRFVGTGGLTLMKMKRKRAKAAASKGAAKKAPKRKKATKRKKAKKK
ncbi:MAG TPA: hypothetical protein VGU20_06880 [Stellaceae bacterium]|nr:hypothetical protein [Stellaceae bacterium]